MRLALPHITFTAVLCRLASLALPQGPCCCLTYRVLWDLFRAPHQPVAFTEGERKHKQLRGRMNLMQMDIYKKTELIKYMLSMHYEMCLPAE